MSEKEFVDGLYIYPPHEKAPDFVKASISIDRKKLGNWLRGRTEEKIRIDVKNGNKGWYCEVNTWKPKEGKETQGKDTFDPDIPF